jgi:CSLREA domain-containing protein
MVNRRLARVVVIAALLLLTNRPLRQLSAAPSVVTFTVDSTLDQIDDNAGNGACHTAANTCTLRAAVMEANLGSGLGATIVVPAGIYSLTIPAAGANPAHNGDLNLTTPTTGDPAINIVGAGAASTIINANQLDRVFRIEPDRTVNITGVTLQNGYAEAGGGIISEGRLTLSHSTIAGNQALIYGGGLYSLGALTVTHTTLSGNLAGLDGAGIFSAGDALVVSHSTIFGNHAERDGGGLYNVGGLSMINSTISLNDADANGGGIYNLEGPSNVYNTTILRNVANADGDEDGGTGGGIFNYGGGVFNLRNTLVAGNSLGGSPDYDDCTGTLNSYGRNLFFSVSGCTIVTSSGGWTTLNSLAFVGPLQNNGGPTWTHALLAGSNAIDSADTALGCVDASSTLLPTDQRGATRIADGDGNGTIRCDIGAFERQPPLYLPLIRR